MLEEWPASVGASATKLLGVGAVVLRPHGFLRRRITGPNRKSRLPPQAKEVRRGRTSTLSSASELSPRDRSFFEGVDGQPPQPDGPVHPFAQTTHSCPNLARQGEGRRGAKNACRRLREEVFATRMLPIRIRSWTGSSVPI